MVNDLSCLPRSNVGTLKCVWNRKSQVAYASSQERAWAWQRARAIAMMTETSFIFFLCFFLVMNLVVFGWIGVGEVRDVRVDDRGG